ncbi:MAG: SMC family ATPase, partial [Bacteroidota bacterium]
ALLFAFANCEELEDQLQREKSTQNKLTKELNKLEEIKALGEELEKQKQLVEGLENEEKNFQQREVKLKNYESCLVDFKPLLDKREEDALSFSKNEQNLRLKKEDRDENIRELEKAEAAFQQVKVNYESREQFLKRAEEFELVIELKESAQNIGKLEERISNGEQFTDKQKRDLEQMRLDLTNKSAEIRKLREKRPEMEQIIKLKDWFNQKENRERELELNRKQVEEIQKEEVELADEKADLLKTLPLHISQYKLETDQLLQLGKQRLDELQKQYEQQERELEDSLGQSYLVKVAQELADGEACPLCGSVHHPSPAVSMRTDVNVEELRKKILLAKQQILQEEKAQLQLQVVGDKESKLRQKKISAESALSKAAQERDKHEAQFVWKDFDKSNPEQSQKILQELSATDIQINLLNQEWEALEKSIEKEDQTRDRYLKELEKIKRQREQERIQYESQIAKIVHIKIEDFIDNSNTALEQLALQQKELYKGIEDLYMSSEQQILQKRSRVDVLKGEITELEKQEKNLAKKMAESNLQLEERLKKSSFDDLHSIESLLGENINIDAEKQQIHQFRQDLLTAKNTLKNLGDRIQNNSLDLSKYEELKEKIEDLNQKIEEISLDIGGQRKEIKRVEDELKRKAEIGKELQKLQLRAEDIRTLKQLFFKSGFVNYVSSIFLRNLCLAANERFRKLTRGSLSLEPTEGNSFEVRDMLNDGQLRSVKTLSGGQTFQAALSLAIALADQVQQQAMTKQNFFFLDEGFGSQDQKSLQIIFQTLKSLRKENRIVGVISHVEELHQEIDTFLHIENDPTNGSKIRYSWQ